MPTNANTFNSRVTSEALEAKFRQVFPSQGGAELGQDLFASGVITPVVDFSTVAEGSVLGVNLQTAWDFSTGQTEISGGSSTLITTPGFWQVDLNITYDGTTGTDSSRIDITDGLSSKTVWKFTSIGISGVNSNTVGLEQKFVVFLRTGDSLAATAASDHFMQTWYRQIADLNGTLVNPLGFTFS